MKTKSILVLVAVLALACVSSINLQAQTPKYNVTFIQGLQGSRVQASGINNLGEIVGAYQTVEGDSNAFLYSNRGITDLGMLHSFSLGVNDKGQVVGWFMPDPEMMDAFVSAFLYANNEITNLGALPSGTYSYALAINNAGQIVGWSFNIMELTRAVIFSQGNVTDLGLANQPGYPSIAYSINDNYDSTGLGLIVGEATFYPSKIQHAFLYSNGSMIDIDAQYNICHKAFASHQSSLAIKINNANQIIGNCYNEHPAPFSLGFLYDLDEGTLTHMTGEGGSKVFDINDVGQVVGSHLHLNGTISSPFLFMDGVQYNIHDLVPPNFNITGFQPVSINNQGEIVGNLNDIHGTSHGVVLLTPLGEDY